MCRGILSEVGQPSTAPVPQPDSNLPFQQNIGKELFQDSSLKSPSRDDFQKQGILNTDMLWKVSPGTLGDWMGKTE